MIAYLDTSALVKLYVPGEGYRALRAYAARAAALATSAVAYPEARAAFARLLRAGLTSGRQHARRMRRLDADWDGFARIDLTPELVRQAGDVAERYGLRGFDAIHLASGLWLKERSAAALAFVAYDRRLHAAAALAGMATYPRRSRATRR
ncbi:MAG: type II toxin-antitoxin system VapC family toxin [Betaproteobacteria bacterium]